MPTDAAEVRPDPDRHGRRAVWIAYAITMIVACVFHAGKASEERGAFIRWRHQVLEFWQGTNIWDRYAYPNPPILPITLLPLMKLPPMAGAVAWFALKAALAAASIGLCLGMVRDGRRPIPSWVQLLAIVLSIRPILSDLHHGNNNMLILFLIVGALAAWRKGYDVAAGLVLALAITFKVTPALFLPYFAYKRSWRTVGATCLGVALFLVIVPAAVLGPAFNGECLAMWWHRMLSPYVTQGIASPQEVNQSLVGVLSRLLADHKAAGVHGYGGVQGDFNLVSLPPRVVTYLVKGASVALVGLLAFLCRTRTDRRTDPRLLGEFALVVLTMLFVSERSWKHHFVTIILPVVYLVYRLGVARIRSSSRVAIGAALVASALLMATTSSDLGGVFPARRDQDGKRVQGYKVAQYYGMFLWGTVALYLATAWRVRVEGRRPSWDLEPPDEPASLRLVPAPHLAAGSRAAAGGRSG